MLQYLKTAGIAALAAAGMFAAASSPVAAGGDGVMPPVAVSPIPVIEGIGCYWARGRRYCSRYCWWDEGERYCHDHLHEAYRQSLGAADPYLKSPNPPVRVLPHRGMPQAWVPRPAYPVPPYEYAPYGRYPSADAVAPHAPVK